MKNIFLTILTISLFSCGTGTSSTSNEQNSSKVPVFEVNPELVNNLFIVENHNQEKYPFKEVETQAVDLNNDGKLDKISLYIIDNWGDPGNFQKIKIELSGDEPYEFFNYGGWVTFNENYSISEEIAAKNRLTSQNILLLNATPKSKLILVFGWVYANNPGLATIIDPSSKTILFNKEWDLQQISDANSDNFLELHGVSVFDGTLELLNFANLKIELKKEK